MDNPHRTNEVNAESKSLRVVIVDDETLIRTGLTLLLNGYRGITVVGEASNGKEALGLIQRTSPDAVLMDIRMPVMDGITAVHELNVLQGGAGVMVPVIMLTAFDTEDFILDALRAGARGFLLKTTDPQALHAAILAAVEGQQLLSPQVLQTLVSSRREEPPPGASAARPAVGNSQSTAAVGNSESQDAHSPLNRLSVRESQIAELVAQGLSNEAIAQQLFIALPTVKTHIARVLDKLEVENRVQIAITVLEARAGS